MAIFRADIIRLTYGPKGGARRRLEAELAVNRFLSNVIAEMRRKITSAAADIPLFTEFLRHFSPCNRERLAVVEHRFGLASRLRAFSVSSISQAILEQMENK
ncbi:hypothetical protein XH94_18845 [Bradyrhizobium zhanjiangense]|uniref:Uncharacterized protein n=1 Tax=Bradyrhizobium zhanjiangense TaxID=1325107 RepID=A0A4Q0SKY6_9BRAD|nr:hypothetical protein XH94_18845 [Bradyrhizobium zhanjiangense]